MWQKRGVKDAMGGETIADTFIMNGVPIIKADNDRMNGWMRVRENLAVAPDGRPYVQIFSTCRNLIRTLPLLSYDKHDHEDVGDNQEDHAAESLRYGLMTRPSPAKRKQEEVKRRIAIDPLTSLPRKQEGGFFGKNLKSDLE